MFRKLQSRLTLAFVIIAIFSVAIVSYLFRNAASIEMQVYLKRGTGFWFAPDGPVEKALIDLAEQQYLSALRLSAWQASIVAVAAAGLLAFIFARQLSKPLNELTRAATNMATNKNPGSLVDLAPKPLPGEGEVARLSRAFNYLAQSLDRQEETRRDFLASVTHELRTPLTIIQGKLEALLDGVAEPTPSEFALLHKHALLLGRLVSDLETLALAQAHALNLDLSDLDPLSIAQSAIETYKDTANKMGLELVLDAKEPLPIIRADNQRVSEVLHNLLSNAIRHTAKGRICLKVEKGNRKQGKGTMVSFNLDFPYTKKDEGIIFSISDTGEGIPKKFLGQVFQQFVRVDASRARKSGGSGLGLAIVRYLVESHGGALWANSTVGKGTTVSFWLPLTANKAVRPKTRFLGFGHKSVPQAKSEQH
jgi:two-component system sensor histidine kinase BaeS